MRHRGRPGDRVAHGEVRELQRAEGSSVNKRRRQAPKSFTQDVKYFTQERIDKLARLRYKSKAGKTLVPVYLTMAEMCVASLHR